MRSHPEVAATTQRNGRQKPFSEWMTISKTTVWCCVLVVSLSAYARTQSMPDTKGTPRTLDLLADSGTASIPSSSLELDHRQPAPVQRFVCNTGYTQELCDSEMAVLRTALAKFPVRQLGNWSWILVREEDWKAIVVPRNLGRDCPAFTYFAKRQTFIEEALVKDVGARNRELRLKWKSDTQPLLDQAIRYQLDELFYKNPEGNRDYQAARFDENGTPSEKQKKIQK